MDFSAIIPLIGEAVNLAISIAGAVQKRVDPDRWREFSPKIQELLEEALNGEDFTHHELMEYIPSEFKLALLQLQKRKQRIELGLEV